MAEVGKLADQAEKMGDDLEALTARVNQLADSIDVDETADVGQLAG